MKTRQCFFKGRCLPGSLLALLILLIAGASSDAEVATQEEATRVATNWVVCIVELQGHWAGDKMPALESPEQVLMDNTVIGYYFPVSPSGYVAVPALKELPPVMAYSEFSRLRLTDTQGLSRLLLDTLEHRSRLYIKTYGSMQATQGGSLLFGKEQRSQWDVLTQDTSAFRISVASLFFSGHGPLLTTAWDQRFPYNDDCPAGFNAQTCLTGCVATAMAQVMRYWSWPPFGSGSHSYAWDGDDHRLVGDDNVCYGGTAGAGTLNADFSDAYDWAHMPDGWPSSDTDAIRALAEICYEAGVSVDMDYGTCTSGTQLGKAQDALPEHFQYEDSIVKEERSAYSASTWFSLIQDEINNERPALYRIKYDPASGHAIVCDGWRAFLGIRQYHINYGWADYLNTDAWYTVDDIYHSLNPDDEFLLKDIRPHYATYLQGYVYDGQGGPLTHQGSPYLVIDDVVVPSGRTLTVQPDSYVYFLAGTSVTTLGVLRVNGHEDFPVHFLSDSRPRKEVRVSATFVLQNGGTLVPGD